MSVTCPLFPMERGATRSKIENSTPKNKNKKTKKQNKGKLKKDLGHSGSTDGGGKLSDGVMFPFAPIDAMGLNKHEKDKYRYRICLLDFQKNSSF